MNDSQRSLGEALTALSQLRTQAASRQEPLFHQRLAQLREWQSEHMAAFHAERAGRHDGGLLLDFLTRRFYRDADWSELTGRPEKVAVAVSRIIDHDRPLVITIELQVAAETLDMAMADAMLTDNAELNPFSYVRAIRRVGQPEARLQQILWLEELVELVGDYADSRAAWWAFRLARTPAHTLGLGKTYDLLADGFKAMRATRDLTAGTHEVITAQRHRLARLIGQPLPG